MAGVIPRLGKAGYGPLLLHSRSAPNSNHTGAPKSLYTTRRMIMISNICGCTWLGKWPYLGDCEFLQVLMGPPLVASFWPLVGGSGVHAAMGRGPRRACGSTGAGHVHVHAYGSRRVAVPSLSRGQVRNRPWSRPGHAHFKWWLPYSFNKACFILLLNVMKQHPASMSAVGLLLNCVLASVRYLYHTEFRL